MTTNLFFERIAQHYASDLPFVVYRKPSEVRIKAVLQNDDTLHLTEDFTESGFVFAPFNSDEKSVLIPFKASENMEFVIPVNAEIQEKKKSFNKKIPAFDGKTEKKEHIKLVQKGIDAINNNLFKKVVLSRCESISISENSPIETFKKLLNNYKSAFVYCWYHPKVGLWLGATPETLLKIEGNRFETMSLAGTQDYNGSLEVEWQAKEIEEQQIVTDSIVNSLESQVSTFNISEVRTVKAGNLLHLKTSVNGTLNSKLLNLKQLIDSLHPTPAICGFPKEKARQFILENEAYHRNYYTGFLGELNLKETRSRNTNRRNVENNAYASVKTITNLFVNLRCMQLKEQQALIYVGGGITKASIPEREWEETLNKTKTMKKVLAD